MTNSLNDATAVRDSSRGNGADLNDNRWRAGSDRLYSSYGANHGDNFTNNSSGVNNSGGLLSAAVRYTTVTCLTVIKVFSCYEIISYNSAALKLL